MASKWVIVSIIKVGQTHMFVRGCEDISDRRSVPQMLTENDPTRRRFYFILTTSDQEEKKTHQCELFHEKVLFVCGIKRF